MKRYPEFGDLTFVEVLNRLHIAEVITQVNAVEFSVNDFLAAKECGEAATAEEYFRYMKDKLIGKSTRDKCKKMISIFEQTDALKRLSPNRINRQAFETILDEWLTIRNRFAHGQIVLNSSGVPTIYHNGECFDIASSTQQYLDNQELLLRVLASYGELHSAFRNKPFLVDSSNTPDNPKYYRRYSGDK